ncbi:MAG: hypothetical protein K2P93_08200 [Alphaproteobacteria bacterium]|nr:hypothetical protein [Alphaproteobacteria bacterium]
MAIKINEAVSPQDIQKYFSLVLDYLNKNKIDKIVSLNINLSLSSHVESTVVSLSGDKKCKIIRLKIEKRVSDEIKINMINLEERELKNLTYGFGPVQLGDPKKSANSFDPAIPLLPSYWGGN